MAATVSAAATPTPVSAHRTYGPDRYVTAAQLEDPARDVAYVVTGRDFPDGLTAGALAGTPGRNVFLTPREELPEPVRAVLGYYRRIVVVGGEASVGDPVMTWLQRNTRAELVRVAGASRYETAARLSATGFPAGVGNVLVTTGAAFPDALAGSAAAAKASAPLLLVEPGAVPEATRAELVRLRPAAITVLGGEGAVSAQVLAELQATTAAPVTRVAGRDRYATAVAVSERFFPLGAPTAQLASGVSWPDAVAAGAFAGRRSSPLLLTPRDCLPQSVNLELERLAPQVLQAVGGDVTYSAAAARRTSCGAEPRTYLDELPAPVGNAAFVDSHAVLGGTFFPRSVGYLTDPRNSEHRTWTLGGAWSTFTATVGVADATTSGLSSRVEVVGDERTLATYDVAAGRPAAVRVDVRGVQRLTLVTTSSARTADPADRDAHTVHFGDAGLR
nr:cell wall-binding repeat-containing protein [Kineococcus siccus]